MKLLKAIFSRGWRWTTLLVIIGMIFLARLGFWQLDRLEQRRAYNEATMRHLAAEPLTLTAGAELPADLRSLRNRRAIAGGKFDYSQQLLLVQQRSVGQLGGHLLAPLVLEGGQTAVLVDRGWVPLEMSDPATWAELDGRETAVVEGYLQLTQTLPNGRSVVPESPQLEWFRIDIAAIQAQMPYELLPVYLLQAPAEGERVDQLVVAPLPRREAPDLNLTEGSHLSYALQWFSFSLLLGGGYLGFVHNSLKQG